MVREPLPGVLSGRAFTTGRARQLGLGEGRLRGSDLDRPMHGLRTPAMWSAMQGRAPNVATIRGAQAAALVLPADVAYSHCTAAALLGLPLPGRHEHHLPLHVMRSTPHNRVDRPQVLAHRGLESRNVVTAHGVATVDEADTWVDLAAYLGVEELVVVGDAVARRADSLEPLRTALERRARVRGGRALREALRWVRVGSDSPMESRSRLVLCRHGLPEPELNVEIGDADGSGFLCRGDLVWRAHRVIGEYQGSSHFESFERADDDITRRLLAQDDGWTYLEITKRDHLSPARRHSMLQRFARHLGVDRVADRPSPDWERRFPTPSRRCSAGEVTPGTLSAVRRR